MLELKTKQLDVKFEDKIYKLRYPTVKELKKFSDKEKQADSLQAVTDLFVKVGLPENIVDKLEADHVEALAKELTTKKK